MFDIVIYENIIVALIKFILSLLNETATSPTEDGGDSQRTIVHEIHFAGTTVSPNLQHIVSSYRKPSPMRVTSVKPVARPRVGLINNTIGRGIYSSQTFPADISPIPLAVTFNDNSLGAVIGGVGHCNSIDDTYSADE